MQSLTRAARSISYSCALASDLAGVSSGNEKLHWQHRADLLTPVAKAFSTDVGVEVASLSIQVHGGMGYIEETGAARLLRDARIAPIYEGTNGIQAIDLVTRKLPLEDGEHVHAYIGELAEVAASVEASNRPEFGRTAAALRSALGVLSETTRHLQEEMAEGRTDRALAGATPYLRLFALAAGGHYLAKSALEGLEEGGAHAMETVAMARFFAENVSVAAPGLAAIVTSGSHAVIGTMPEAAPA